MNTFITLIAFALLTLLSVVASAQAQEQENKTFDEEGKLVQEIDEQGKLVHYIYDEDGVLVAKYYEDGAVVKIPRE